MKEWTAKGVAAQNGSTVTGAYVCSLIKETAFAERGLIEHLKGFG